MSQPKFSEVLRAAAIGINKTVNARYQYSSARMYGPGGLEAEDASYRALSAQVSMLNSIAELYEKYEQAQQPLA